MANLFPDAVQVGNERKGKTAWSQYLILRIVMDILNSGVCFTHRRDVESSRTELVFSWLLCQARRQSGLPLHFAQILIFVCGWILPQPFCFLLLPLPSLFPLSSLSLRGSVCHLLCPVSLSSVSGWSSLVVGVLRGGAVGGDRGNTQQASMDGFRSTQSSKEEEGKERSSKEEMENWCMIEWEK